MPGTKPQKPTTNQPNHSKKGRKPKKQLSPVAKTFLGLFCAFMMSTFVKSMVDFRELASKYNVTVRDINDLWLVLGAAVICGMFKPFVNYFLKDWIVNKIKVQNRPDEDVKIKKNLKQVKDIFYYGAVSVSQF